MITNYFKTLSCRRIAPLLFAQSQNAELSPADAAKLSAHLFCCASCQNEAAQFARMARDLRGAIPAAPLPSADLWSRIQAEITTDAPRVSPTPQRPALRPTPLAPRMGGLAWAGSAAIVFVGGAWMTYGAGFWGHANNGQGQLPAVTGAVSSERASVTLIPPASVSASPAASNTGTVAKAAAKKASRNEAASIAQQTAPPVRSSFVTRPDPFAPVSTPPSKPAINGTFVNRTRTSRPQQTNPNTLGALARLQMRDAREAGRDVTGTFAATTKNIPGFDGHGTAFRNGLTSSEAIADGSNTATSSAPGGPIATTVPSAFEGEPAATIAATVPTALPMPTGVESAAPLGVSAAFTYSAVKPTAELERATDSSALDDAEPRSIPPAGSGGAFSVGESTSRMRRQRALFSYGRP